MPTQTGKETDAITKRGERAASGDFSDLSNHPGRFSFFTDTADRSACNAGLPVHSACPDAP